MSRLFMADMPFNALLIQNLSKLSNSKEFSLYEPHWFRWYWYFSAVMAAILKTSLICISSAMHYKHGYYILLSSPSRRSIAKISILSHTRSWLMTTDPCVTITNRWNCPTRCLHFMRRGDGCDSPLSTAKLARNQTKKIIDQVSDTNAELQNAKVEPRASSYTQCRDFGPLHSKWGQHFLQSKIPEKWKLLSNIQQSSSSRAAATLQRSETTTERRRSITAVDVIWFVKFKFKQFAQQLQVTCASLSLTFVCNDARVSRGDNKQTLLLFLGVHAGGGGGGEHIINFQMATSPASQWLSIFSSYKRHHITEYSPIHSIKIHQALVSNSIIR